MQNAILVRRRFRKKVRETGVQVSTTVFIELNNFIEGRIDEALEQMANNKVARADVQSFIESLNIRPAQEGEEVSEKIIERPCQKCAGIKDVFLKAARQLQVLVTDEAKIALLALERGKKYVK